MSNNIFYDFEFHEDGRVIVPISVGMVKDTGESFYAQSLNFNPKECNRWVQEHVLPHLYSCPRHEEIIKQAEDEVTDALHYEMWYHKWNGCSEPDCPWMLKDHMAEEIKNFVGAEAPTFYGWYSAYDHVALAQLYGPMVELPANWPMYTFDIRQWHAMVGEPVIPLQESTVHNALNDAKENLRRYQFLKEYTISEMKRIDSFYRTGHMGF